MKTPSFLKHLAFCLLGVLFFGTSHAAVDAGLSVSGTTLTLSLTPDQDYNVSPSNLWADFVFTIRWQENAANADPVTSMSFTLLESNASITQDPSTASAPIKDGQYYYKIFVGTPSPLAPVNMLNGVPIAMFSLDFATTASTIDFELITGNAFTNARNSNASVNNLLLNQQFNTFNPSVATFSGSSFPVEWLFFEANPVNSRDAQLKWATGTETNNDYFQIEKSVDGELFETIAKVDGAGNASTVKEYQYLDEDFVSERIYYRLKQVDFNGQYHFSERVEVNFDPTLPTRVSFELFPNPSVDFVTIKPQDRIDGVYRLLVIDMGGRTVYNGTFDGNENAKTIQVDDFAEGLYMVYLSGGKLSGAHLAGKFVKK